MILSQLALGWTAVSWPLSPLKLTLFVWHKSIGLLLLNLAIMRLLWRSCHPRPAWPGSIPRGQRLLATLVQGCLYLLLLALPISGWIINSAANIPFRVFWLVPLPDIVAPDKALQNSAELIHLSLFWLLAVLVTVHIAGAVKHHLLDRDLILRAMLPASCARGADAKTTGNDV